MDHKRNMSKNGFSLLELSIVMIIISLIAGTIFTIVPIQQSRKIHEDFETKLDTIQTAIDTFVKQNGRLPCPAARNAALNSATFGVETSCAAATATGTVEIAGVAANENLRIGALPTRTLNLPDSYMFDPWNNRIDYVTVKSLANTSALFSAYATTQTDTIRINDLNGNRINQASSVSIPNFVSYAVISHGEDGSGATNLDGSTTRTCPSTGADKENCDNDTVFMDAFYNSAAATFYDDYIRWKTYQSLVRDSSLAASSGSSGGGGGGSGMGLSKYGLFTHTETSNDGGNAGENTWQTRVLNTTKYNTLTSATRASNMITLGAGTYYIRASAAAYRVDENKIRLFNVTTGSTIIVGTAEYAKDDNAQSRSFLSASVTFASPTQIRVDHYTNESRSTNGLGKKVTSSTDTGYDFVQLEIFEQ